VKKVVFAGLMAVVSLFAQALGGGPRGRGPIGWGPGGREFRQVVTEAPYSAAEVRTSQQVLANGTVIQHQEQVQIYRDSQGRVRTETTRQGPNGQTRTLVTIADPVAGVVHELDVANKTSFDRPARFANQTPTSNSSNARLARAARTSNTAETREAIGTQTINGVTASGSRVTRSIPAGSIGNSQAIQRVQETWMSEDLKVPVMTRVSDPRSGTEVAQLTNINRSEPDASLFLVPPDYTVRTAPAGRRKAAR
jgi:hypothetical protein